MTNLLSASKLTLLLLALATISFSSCEDDDDILGMDFNDDGTLFISSNTQARVGVIDTRDSDNREVFTFDAAGLDSDGIYFDERGDGLLYQVNRSDNQLVQYEDVLDDINDDEGVNISLRSASGGFNNGRGLTAVDNSQFLVAQDDSDDDDDNDDNSLVLYSNTNGDAITRTATYNVDFNLWGIQYDNGTLYAVVDNTDSVAIFNNLFATADGDTATADRFIKIDGIGRTHGLEYYPEDDLMLLTDIGSAGSDSDGAIIVIRNFSTLTGNTITSANYTRIAGASTLLGNPVDVAYDEDGERIWVAERARNGGLVLAFDLDQEGDVAPRIIETFAGASSLYLNND